MLLKFLGNKSGLVVAIAKWDFFYTVQDALKFFFGQRNSFSQKTSQVFFILYRNLIVFVSEVEHRMVFVHLGHVLLVADWVDHFWDAFVLQFQVYNGKRRWQIKLFLVGGWGSYFFYFRRYFEIISKLFLVGGKGSFFLGVSRYFEIIAVTLNNFVYLVCDCCLLCNSKERLSVATVLTLLRSFPLTWSTLGVTLLHRGLWLLFWPWCLVVGLPCVSTAAILVIYLA